MDRRETAADWARAIVQAWLKDHGFPADLAERQGSSAIGQGAEGAEGAGRTEEEGA